MNTTKVILTTLSLLCVILAARSIRVASQSDSGSKEKEVSQAENIKNHLNEITQIAVFQWISKDRQYIGSLKKDTPAFQSALKALQESQTTDTSDVTKPEYEMVLMGEGVQHLAKYDVRVGAVTLYPPEREGKPTMTVQLSRSFADLLTSAKLPDQPQEGFRPQHISESFWAGLPNSLVRAVAQSPVILIGKSVDLFRFNYFDPSDTKSPVQYVVYVIEVERYLKDDTGQFMSFIKYWDWGGLLGGGYEMRENPLLKYNQRYILFLNPGNNRLQMWKGKWIRLWYTDEFRCILPWLQTPIVSGVTVQRYPPSGPVPYIYFFGDKTTLVGKPEGEVINEIMAAIKQAEKERR
jgi:hypothetical protein